MSILEISKTLIYEFWYDYIKPKYQDNAKLCYMDIDSFIINILSFIINTEDFYEDIADDVEKRFDTPNYEVDRPLPTGKNKKVMGLTLRPRMPHICGFPDCLILAMFWTLPDAF